MANLLYGTKSEELLSRAQLEALPAGPKRGTYHNPVPYIDFVNYTEDRLSDLGLTVTREEFITRNGHMQFFGAIEVSSPEIDKETTGLGGYRWIIGLRASHDQSIARGMVLGTQVLVCSNLCFHGDMGEFHTRHTTHIGLRLGRMITEAVEKLPEAMEEHAARVRRLKEVELPDQRANDLLINIYRKGGLSSAQLGHAVNEWYQPKYGEHGSWGRSAWRLLQSCTEAIKPTGATGNTFTIERRSRLIFNEIVREAA